MRIVCCLLLTCYSVACLAQEDAFPDYRSKKESVLRMQEKNIRAEIVTFALAGIDERIGRPPLKAIPPVAYGSNYLVFQGDNIKVTITAGSFDSSKHKLRYYDEKYLVRIDGKPYFGNYGSMPQKTIAGVTVLLGKDTVAIPPEAYADLYSPDFVYTDASGTIRTHDGVYLSADGHRIYIYMLNDEAKGHYEVTWVIQDKKYLRRVVDANPVE